jgi:hypothetical protein
LSKTLKRLVKVLFHGGLLQRPFGSCQRGSKPGEDIEKFTGQDTGLPHLFRKKICGQPVKVDAGRGCLGWRPTSCQKPTDEPCQHIP